MQQLPGAEPFTQMLTQNDQNSEELDEIDEEETLNIGASGDNV